MEFSGGLFPTACIEQDMFLRAGQRFLIRNLYGTAFAPASSFGRWLTVRNTRWAVRVGA